MIKLVIKEIINEQGEVNYIQIVEQSHIVSEVSEISTGGSAFTSSRGFRLMSSCVPQIKENGLYVRGSTKSENNKVLQIPGINWLNNMRHAVLEYMTLHNSGDCDYCVNRHCNNCEFKN